MYPKSGPLKNTIHKKQARIWLHYGFWKKAIIKDKPAVSLKEQNRGVSSRG